MCCRDSTAAILLPSCTWRSTWRGRSPRRQHAVSRFPHPSARLSCSAAIALLDHALAHAAAAAPTAPSSPAQARGAAPDATHQSLALADLLSALSPLLMPPVHVAWRQPAFAPDTTLVSTDLSGLLPPVRSAAIDDLAALQQAWDLCPPLGPLPAKQAHGAQP